MKRTVTAISACLLVAMHGCGTDIIHPLTHLEGNCTVVLDWTGGYSPIWSGEGDLPPIDLAAFKLERSSPGRTLADVDGFTEMVRAEVENVLSGSGLHVTVEEGEQRDNVTVVHFSQVVDPENYLSLGRGHFDICNIRDQDYSIVYARLLEGSRNSEVRWVRTFANVAAHEIAHNLGFDHVKPEDVPDSEFAELMLANQSAFQRVREQRIIVEQDTCAAFDRNMAKSDESFDQAERLTRD